MISHLSEGVLGNIEKEDLKDAFVNFMINSFKLQDAEWLDKINQNGTMTKLIDILFKLSNLEQCNSDKCHRTHFILSRFIAKCRGPINIKPKEYLACLRRVFVGSRNRKESEHVEIILTIRNLVET